jgi:hypothetical protein
MVTASGFRSSGINMPLAPEIREATSARAILRRAGISLRAFSDTRVQSVESTAATAPADPATLLAGCVAPSQMMVNGQGQMVRCSATGWGYIGAPLAYHPKNVCVADYEKIGYRPIEETVKKP